MQNKKVAIMAIAACALVALSVPLVITGCGAGPTPEQEIAKDRKDRSKTTSGAAKPDGQKPVAPKPPKSGGEAYPADKGVATLAGVVKITGTVPKRAPVEMTADPKCHEMHKERPLAETVVALETGELANCIIFVSAGLEKYKFEAPETPVVVDQVGCVYVPHTFAAMVGQPIHLRNSDPTAHNVHELKDRFNKQQAKQGQVDTVTIDEVDASGLKCDIHPWMNANYRTFEHPFFAVSDGKGGFKIAQKLLPGKYKVACWHLKYKEVEKEIEVKEGDTEVKVDFEFASK